MGNKWTLKDIEDFSKKKANAGQTLNIRTKYNNVKTDGFDSKKEAAYFAELKIKEKAGLVTAIQCQVRFKLSVCVYVADFVYLNLESGCWDTVDVKGVRTATYRLKQKMMENELKIKVK
jgi:hypothetical protein